MPSGPAPCWWHAPGADNPALYVALSRVLMFVAHQELETPQDGHVGGRLRGAVDRLRRVTAKLAEQAQASATHGDDRPALDDLRAATKAADRGRGDDDGADSTGRRWRGGHRFAGRGRDDRQPQDLDDVDRRQPRRPNRPQPEREQPSRRGRDRGAER